MEACAISGGRIELEWLYDPTYEYLRPGAAREGRLYWDAGTGEIGFDVPHATVPMDHPTSHPLHLAVRTPHRRAGIPLRHPHRYGPLAVRPRDPERRRSRRRL